jgi:hypothetical protein
LSTAKEAEKRWRYFSVYISLVGYTPESNNVRIEAEGSPLLRAVTKRRVMKTLLAGEESACSDL